MAACHGIKLDAFNKRRAEALFAEEQQKMLVSRVKYEARVDKNGGSTGVHQRGGVAIVKSSKEPTVQLDEDEDTEVL